MRETPSAPQIGMVATVRNRRGVISAVRPYDAGPAGRVHLVDVEYNDGDAPLEESLLWEREPGAHLVPPAALPDPNAHDPMAPEDLVALVRACRWSARTPFIDPDGSGPIDRLPVSSPFHGAIRVEDYQLVPLLKALRMPRVSLLLADDVGLGKTIEAGLILQELLLRRRIRRVLVLTPASLRNQWRDELLDKFSLPFEIVDRGSTRKLRQRLGLDANPWRSHSRIIASYHYLKQADVLEQFRSASEAERTEGRLPWDLLIVDEAHHLTPAPFGDESDLCQMLRQVGPLFEHRIFLTATPHNGHTRSFTGLLEMLDPVRFSQTDEFRPAERERVQDVLVRRLKREINERSAEPRFSNRLSPQALPIERGEAEIALSTAFVAFRSRIRELMREAVRRRRLAGNFAIEILGKRLLSGPVAFAESWRRVREGLEESPEDGGASVTTEETGDSEVLAARRSVEEETVDDREAESRTRTAAATVGAWLRPLRTDLADEIAALDAAVDRLFPGPSSRSDPAVLAGLHAPSEDSRFRRLRASIDDLLFLDGEWRDDERIVVFTEYKTTLDYLLDRLRAEFGPERVLFLFGGMDDSDRDPMKNAFNDPDDPVRILVATDAAAEGLNLHETARHVLHWDVPWNPARVEQRNGRVDRHGQARDVHTYHFVSDDDDDLRFLDMVVGKVATIREDLGATGDVFDELTHRRLVEGESLDTVQLDLDERVDAARELADIPRDDDVTPGEGEPSGGAPGADLEAIAAELDLSPETLRATLDGAMALGNGRPRVTEPDDAGRCRLLKPPPPPWEPVIDDSLRLPGRSADLGPLRGVAFDPHSFEIMVGSFRVFRPRKDTALLHLAHPMFQKTLAVLTRQRFPGSVDRAASRWTVRRGAAPEGAEALLLVTVEELAVNDLRETFHHWVRTLGFPINDGELGDRLPHQPARETHAEAGALAPHDIEKARDLWTAIHPDMRKWLRAAAAELTEELRTQLAADLGAATDAENERYRSRQGEVSALIEGSTMARLERQLEELRARHRQGLLFHQARELDELERDIERREEELERRRRHYEEVREQLARERKRILEELLPKRYAMRGEAQVLPVAVEIVCPGGDQ